eukprot:1459897-Pyramimonas_sp.AAC.1
MGNEWIVEWELCRSPPFFCRPRVRRWYLALSGAAFSVSLRYYLPVRLVWRSGLAPTGRLSRCVPQPTP